MCVCAKWWKWHVSICIKSVLLYIRVQCRRCVLLVVAHDYLKKYILYPISIHIVPYMCMGRLYLCVCVRCTILYTPQFACNITQTIEHQFACNGQAMSAHFLCRTRFRFNYYNFFFISIRNDNDSSFSTHFYICRHVFIYIGDAFVRSNATCAYTNCDPANISDKWWWWWWCCEKICRL